MTAIGLGFRAHTGWAVVVGVSGPASAPVIVHRNRVELADPDARAPYHAAADLSLDEAQALITSAEEAAATAAAGVISELAASLGSVKAVGVVAGERRLPKDLARILASHAFLHASEGDLYEQALIEGSARAGLPVTTIPVKGTLDAPLDAALGAAGRVLGPPWQKDHRQAAAAALAALGAL